MKILTVVGVRPNIMKFAAWHRAIENSQLSLCHVIVHSGQHYDDNIFYDIWEELELPEINYHLRVGSGTNPWQIATIMIELEKVIAKEKPDWVIAIDDVNTALAAGLTARKMDVKVAHIEAGIRSFDKTMPEEINRILVDNVSDLLIVPDEKSYQRLKMEGILESNMVLAGNFMADTLLQSIPRAAELKLQNIIEKNSIDCIVKDVEDFILFTLHRPSNVLNNEVFRGLVELLLNDQNKLCETILWPVHPGVLKMLKQMGLYNELLAVEHIILLKPLGYFEMINLITNASFILTDSGGLQEETTILGKMCLTMRNNTERPITLIENGGTNKLIGNLPKNIRKSCHEVEFIQRQKRNIPFWEGKAAERALNSLVNF